MQFVRIKWDAAKNASNQRKHGVSFEEAQSAFADEQGIVIADPDHSDDEDRFILLGASASRLLVVCHCYREDDGVIRIFSARTANGQERRTYAQRWLP